MQSKVITAGGETKLSYFKSYSSGARSWSVGHIPSTTKVKSVAGSTGYATIELSVAEKNATYVTNLQTAGIKVLSTPWTNPVTMLARCRSARRLDV
jgi:hypothetical protein